MTIELHLLGGFDLRIDGSSVPALRAAGPSRLLAYLALHRDTRPRRLYLAGLFWPDGSERRARRRLSHNLWVLQSALAPVAPDLVTADRDTIGIGAATDLWIDVEAFEDGCRRFDELRRDGDARRRLELLEHTLHLYRGDLLADHYDEWVEGRRQRLRERFLASQRLLVQLQKSRGEYDRALVSARRLVAEAPLSEQGHAELIRLYWLSGRTEDALAQYTQCRRILDDELGLEPGEELRTLHRRIVDTLERAEGRGLGAGGESRPSEPLVGRAAERSRLLELVDRAGGGNGGVALVEGAPGIGRSRLLQEVADAARWRGATVVWARHSSSRRLEPYGGITRALGTVLQGLRREQVLARLSSDWLPLATQLLPGLATPEPPLRQGGPWTSSDERWRHHEALVQVVLALGAATPSVLIVDDLHLADTESLEFLRLLAPRLADRSVALLLGYRTQEARNRSEVWVTVTDIDQHQRAIRIALRGLERREIHDLVALRSGSPPSEHLVEGIAAATGGNPLYVVETIRAIERDEDGSIGASDDLGIGRITTADSILEVVLQEIDAAPEHVRDLIAVLAIWGAPASSSTIARMLDVDALRALETIEAGIGAEFVVEVDGGYDLRFRHLATAARARLGDERRRVLHRRAGDILAEDTLAPAADLAAHYRAARAWSAAARHESAAAARAAALHSYDVAVQFYELALSSIERAGQSPSSGVLFGFESVLDALGRRDEQHRVLELLEARKEAGTSTALRTMQRRALHLAGTDDLMGAIRVASSALGHAVAAGADWRPSSVTLARVLIMAGHPHLAMAHLDGVLTTDRHDVGLAQAQLALGSALSQLQDWTAAREHLESSLDLFRSHGDPRGQVEALTAIAVLHSQAGDAIAALRHYHEAITLARRIGHRYGEGVACTNLATFHYLQGDVASALARMDDAIEVFTTIGHRRGEAMVRANAASLWHTVIGDDERAERDTTAARRYFSEIGDERREAQCLDVLAGIRRRRRAHAVSRRLLERALGVMRSSPDRWLEVQMLRSLAWTELEAGRTAPAAKVIADAIAACRHAGLDIELPVLLALEARILASLGHHERAVEAARESATLDAQSDLRHVAALWRHEAFALAGHGEEAAAEIALAHKLLSTMLAPVDPQTRAEALARVQEHRRILDLHEAHFPRILRVLLPAARPDGPATVEVRWTVHDPDDLAVAGKRARRMVRLSRLLDEAGAAGAAPRRSDLAEALGISLSTLKRDLGDFPRDRGPHDEQG